MSRTIKWNFFIVIASLGMLASFAANAATLFGVSLNGFDSSTPGPSSLYKIDPVTGAATLIGTDLGYPVNSIAIDPTTGIMYASTANWSDDGIGRLLQIDPVTGTATDIGSTGLMYCCRVITFNSAGELWGWEEDNDSPVTINKSTGAASPVGDSGIGTARQVMAFDAAENLIMIQSDEVYTIDQATGAAVLGDTLSFDPGAGGADFDPSTGLLWASQTRGSTEDSIIRVTDVAGDSFTDIDTDMTYLIAVTFGDAVTVAGKATIPIPVPAISIWGLGILITLMGVVGFSRRKRLI